jgi:hypothetical protein
VEHKIGLPDSFGLLDSAGLLGDRRRRGSLLDALLLPVPTNERIEDSKDVAAVFDHAGENVAKSRLALRFAMPLSENGGWYFDVAAQLLRGMPAEEEAVEKSSFALRKIEVQRDFGGNELCHRSHGERAVYRKASRRQVVPTLNSTGRVTPFYKPRIRCTFRVPDTTSGLLGRL